MEPGVERTARFYERLRRDPGPSTVPGSLPVLFFGDLSSAKVATVGLNPSRREYLDSKGHELTGGSRRFETLGSLGAPDRASLAEAQLEQAIARMRSYFDPGSPSYSWFRGLYRITEPLGGTYAEGYCAQLDLVQEATDPTWSTLKDRRPDEAQALLDADLPFLLWQIEAFPLEVVVCNGRTVFAALQRALGVEVLEEGTLARITWWLATATTGARSLWLLGWNLPLARPTGLGQEGEKELGRLFAERIDARRGSSNHVLTERGLPKFWGLVREREMQIRDFLRWAAERERIGQSLRHDSRRDIRDAAQVAEWFAEDWWAMVVFSCFGSLNGVRAVKDAFSRPLEELEAGRILDMLELPKGAIGHHRIRPGHTGAKRALHSACIYHQEFRRILSEGNGFHDRYLELRDLGAPQWGRTTCFDLLLRAGALGIGGDRYAPERASLADSTGPRRGFEEVWGFAVNRHNADWCEEVLGQWTAEWFEVARRVGVQWEGEAYTPADFENALCIYQESASAPMAGQLFKRTRTRSDQPC